MQPAPQCAGFTYGPQLLKDGAHMEGDMVVVQWEGRRFSVDKADISIKGRHNVYNAMAAILACMRMGLTDDAIRRGLKSFPQVEHRLETVAEKQGVVYINDSKATNVDSAWYALDSMTAVGLYGSG